MNIKSIEVFPLDLPTIQIYQMAKGVRDRLRYLLVKLTTEDGTVGFGEANQSSPHYCPEIFEGISGCISMHLAPALIGGIMDAERSGNLYAKAAIEEAVFDALGKMYGISVSTLLGGPIRKELEVIAWIGISEPEKMAEEARKRVDEGYKTIKLKVGSSTDVHEEIMRVTKVREAVGKDINIRVDANTGFGLKDALRFLKGVESLDLEHFEQALPGWNLEGMARLREASCVPIMADESVYTPQDAYRVLSYGAADCIKIKISKVGGFRKARKIIDIAESAGISIIIGQGFCASIESFAEIHLAASFANVTPVVETVGPMKLVEDVAEDGLKVVEGRVRVPTKPGLGLNIRNELLNKPPKMQ